MNSDGMKRSTYSPGMCACMKKKNLPSSADACVCGEKLNPGYIMTGFLY
jgi:hypothetical protein